MHIAAPERRRHAISLTPLIDVVFILLVFFMLATSFANWRTISVSTGLASSDSSDRPPAVVHVTVDGVLRYQGDRYAVQELASTLKSARRNDRIAGVVIEPAPKTPLQISVQVIDRLSGAGVQSLSLATGVGE